MHIRRLYPWLAALLFSMTGCPVVEPEICDNGIDDDGDWLIDCVDADCAAEPHCKGPILQQDGRMAGRK